MKAGRLMSLGCLIPRSLFLMIFFIGFGVPGGCDWGLVLWEGGRKVSPKNGKQRTKMPYWIIVDQETRIPGLLGQMVRARH